MIFNVIVSKYITELKTPYITELYSNSVKYIDVVRRNMGIMSCITCVVINLIIDYILLVKLRENFEKKVVLKTVENKVEVCMDNNSFIRISSCIAVCLLTKLVS